MSPKRPLSPREEPSAGRPSADDRRRDERGPRNRGEPGIRRSAENAKRQNPNNRTEKRLLFPRRNFPGKPQQQIPQLLSRAGKEKAHASGHALKKKTLVRRKSPADVVGARPKPASPERLQSTAKPQRVARSKPSGTDLPHLDAANDLIPSPRHSHTRILRKRCPFRSELLHRPNETRDPSPQRSSLSVAQQRRIGFPSVAPQRHGPRDLPRRALSERRIQRQKPTSVSLPKPTTPSILHKANTPSYAGGFDQEDLASTVRAKEDLQSPKTRSAKTLLCALRFCRTACTGSCFLFRFRQAHRARFARFSLTVFFFDIVAFFRTYVLDASQKIGRPHPIRSRENPRHQSSGFPHTASLEKTKPLNRNPDPQPHLSRKPADMKKPPVFEPVSPWLKTGGHPKLD